MIDDYEGQAGHQDLPVDHGPLVGWVLPRIVAELNIMAERHIGRVAGIQQGLRLVVLGIKCGQRKVQIAIQLGIIVGGFVN